MVMLYLTQLVDECVGLGTNPRAHWEASPLLNWLFSLCWPKQRWLPS